MLLTLHIADSRLQRFKHHALPLPFLMDSDETEVRGVANFSNVLRGSFHACYLGYSLGEKWLCGM
jgi:hypothetical protein